MACSHQLFTKGLTQEVALEVSGTHYLAPLDDLCLAFCALHDKEYSYLVQVMSDNPAVAMCTNPASPADYECLSLLLQAFGSYDILSNPLNEPLVPTAIPMASKPLLPYA
ncbi:hypothetical protein H4582DRAFT_2086242 [Lactarius indigo]|nr:hypothetical protein H4582DRAFT_2088087 [Lactarius indigo]KAI9430719.1 hypothetical protein H4582DRAFT_2086242 [Lactarius indigo]